jgi:hypothetical protein
MKEKEPVSKRPPSFAVTAAGGTVTLDDSGVASASFTVTNTTPQAVTAELLTRPSDPAKPEWFSIDGESVRDFGPNSAQEVVVKLSVPPGSPPASYSFRLDAVSEDDPDEDYTEGPSVAFDVAAPPPQKKKKFPWWILVVAGAIVLVIVVGVVVFLLTRGDDGGKAAQLVGNWPNVDPNTRSTTHYVIAKSGDTLRISGFGACSPTDCDWAKMVGAPRTVPVADADDGKFTIVWNFGFKTQVDNMELVADKRLEVISTHTFTDGRPGRTETQFFQKAP